MYAKLSSTITRSSIWRESPATRCVWITLLAVANEDGFVKGVEAWLASESNVSREECREALQLFQAEDPESQDQDWGGRRIEKLEGGWLVLNYRKYRDMRTKDQVLAAERQHRKRLRDKKMDDAGGGGGEDVTRRHAPSRSVTASAPAPASESEGSARAREVEPEPEAPPPPGPDPETDLAPHFAHVAHRDAYVGLRAGHRRPQTLDATLREVHAPSTGGAGFTWAEIGAGLLELLGNGEAFNASRLRGYCRQARARPPGVVPSAGSLEDVQVGGGQVMSRSVFWRLCVDAGLAAPMQSAETIRELVERLHGRGLVRDAAAFVSLVLHVEPWALAEIKFGKAREEQLAQRLASWQVPSFAAIEAGA